MTRSISLSRGFYALVDDSDFDELNKWKWYAHTRNNGTYAVRTEINDDGKKSMIYMHRVITGAKYRQEVDHIDHNCLNNRRNNLRLCTRSENCRNSRIGRNNSTGFKGVNFYKRTGRYRAYIKIGDKETHLGYFDNPIEAAKEYDKAAIKHFKEFACTNF